MQLSSGCNFNEASPLLPVVSWLYYLVPCALSLALCSPPANVYKGGWIISLARLAYCTNQWNCYLSFIWPQNYWKLGIINVKSKCSPQFSKTWSDVLNVLLYLNNCQKTQRYILYSNKCWVLLALPLINFLPTYYNPIYWLIILPLLGSWCFCDASALSVWFVTSVTF